MIVKLNRSFSKWLKQQFVFFTIVLQVLTQSSKVSHKILHNALK